MARLSPPCVVALLLVAVAGCGDGRPRRVPVSGQVLLDGKPLSGGFVSVVPQGARPASGPIDAQGRFQLTTYEENDGCVLGTHPVKVIAYDTSNPNQYRSLIPDKYHDTNTSGLTVTIDGPRDDVKIELSWEGESKSSGRVIIGAGDSDPTAL